MAKLGSEKNSLVFRLPDGSKADRIDALVYSLGM